MLYQIVITDSAFSTETPENEIFSQEGYELIRLQCRDEKELRVRLSLLMQSLFKRPLLQRQGSCQACQGSRL